MRLDDLCRIDRLPDIDFTRKWAALCDICIDHFGIGTPLSPEIEDFHEDHAE